MSSRTPKPSRYIFSVFGSRVWRLIANLSGTLFEKKSVLMRKMEKSGNNV